MREMKKVLLTLVLFLLLAVGLGFKSEAETMKIGGSEAGILGWLDGAAYDIKVPRTMKVEFTVVISKIMVENSSWNDEYASIEIDLSDDDLDTVFEKSFSNGNKTWSKTVVLKKGEYLFEIVNGYEGDIKYELFVKDVSEYTTRIKLNKSKHTMYVKNSVKLKATSELEGSYIGDVTWKSSNKKIATVDNKGKVTAKKAGTCFISANIKGGKAVKCKITVKKRPAIYIKEFNFVIDSVGGVKPYFEIENNTGKKIKYIYTTVYSYNAVGDSAVCEIRGKNRRDIRMIGPLKNKKVGKYSFEPIIYNGTTRRIKIKSVTVQFMDNSKKTYSITKRATY